MTSYSGKTREDDRADPSLPTFRSGSIQLWCLFSLSVISGQLYDRVRISQSLLNSG